MDKYEQLEKLTKLKEQGILSEEEFQREKQKVLNISENINNNTKDKSKVVIVNNVSNNGGLRVVVEKNILVSLILTFFFGPLGLFYTSGGLGLLMILVYIVVAIMTITIGLPIVHVITMILGVISVLCYNSDIRKG